MRLRIRYAKLGKIRFVSHRDVARIWERALRRAEVPVAYSEGFSPRPKVAFGLALSTGYESDAEYLDVDVDPARAERVNVALLPDCLSEALPDGITATTVAEIDRREQSLQQAVSSCTWRIDVTEVDIELATTAVARALDADELFVTRERKGRTVIDDIRPVVLAIDRIEPIRDGVRLITELGTQPRGLRPSELLTALDPPLVEQRVHRLHQWITTESGVRSEPLGAAAPPVVALGVRP